MLAFYQTNSASPQSAVSVLHDLYVGLWKVESCIGEWITLYFFHYTQNKRSISSKQQSYLQLKWVMLVRSF